MLTSRRSFLLFSGAIGARAIAGPSANDANNDLPGLIASSRSIDLQKFYFQRQHELAWTKDGAVTPSAKSIIAVFHNAAASGLDPEDYGASLWAASTAEIESGTPSVLARFDAALSAAAMRYVSDLRFGRVNPALFLREFTLNGSNGNLSEALARLVESPDVYAFLASIEPPYEAYRQTKLALARYTDIADKLESCGSPVPLRVPQKTVHPGESYPEIVRLTALLKTLGDLPPATTEPASYSQSIAEGVRNFQARHGLEVDGYLGRATIAELNVPVRRRIRQLELALERWRWLPDSFARPPLIVNIPEFELRALDESLATQLDMRVIVGHAFQHQTPTFMAGMKYVVFSPYWDVPRSIARAELIPRILKDRSYLTKNHFEVVNTRNQPEGNGDVDDALLARLNNGELRIRQLPGPDNSLGLVKFLFPNSYDVYLHGTPAKELFSKTRRDFSHGCIRVEEPEKLAEWVLRDRPEWTPNRIVEAMFGEKPLTVVLDRPIPVLITYITAIGMNDGEVRFAPDIYGRDAELDRALRNRPRRESIS